MVDGVARYAQREVEALLLGQGRRRAHSRRERLLLRFDGALNLGPGDESILIEREPISAFDWERRRLTASELGRNIAHAPGVVQRDLGDVVASLCRPPEGD